MTGSGDPEGMPPFRISAPAPSRISLRSPAVELVSVPNFSEPVAAIRASRSAPLELSWTGVRAFALGANVAMMILNHYAASIHLVLQ